MRSRLLLIFLLVVLTGCGAVSSNVSGASPVSSLSEDQGPELTTPSNYGELPEEVHDQGIGVKLHLKQTTFAPSAESIPFEIQNSGETSITFGVGYTIEKFQHGTWYEYPFKPDVAFILMALILRPGETHKGSVSVDLLKYLLTDGRYRVVKKISADGQSRVLAAKFTVSG
ncbi:MAG TPA: immunoglobulin-like domain-containing protein [Bacillales bacterium]|nr:immunoglobulin-like domain-containing protein [Bacillales bacterium]